MPSTDKRFRELEKVWYNKLRESGFEDIEDTSHPDRLLKSWHSFKYQDIDPIQAEAIQRYFTRARQLLHTFKFKNRFHRTIWALHADGMSERDIHLRVPKYKKSWIHCIIATIASHIV